MSNHELWTFLASYHIGKIASKVVSENTQQYQQQKRKPVK